MPGPKYRVPPVSNLESCSAAWRFAVSSVESPVGISGSPGVQPAADVTSGVEPISSAASRVRYDVFIAVPPVMN